MPIESAAKLDSPTEGADGEITRAIARFGDDLGRVRTAIARRLVGQSEIVDGVITALLAGGHVLLEGVPGLGKTLLVKTLGEALDLTFSRMQFTPDLMPADIVGTNMIVESGGERRFEFQTGPIFANLVLADEINRATPKTQSALLEAMQEQSVTVGKTTYPLSPPFFVLATQNPIEMEGTYPLPEAQLDRFFFKLRVDFPARDELHAILDRTTGVEEGAVGRGARPRPHPRDARAGAPGPGRAADPGLRRAHHRGDPPGALAASRGEARRALRQLAARRAGGDPGGEDPRRRRRALRAILRRCPPLRRAGAAPPRAAELRGRGRRHHHRQDPRRHRRPVAGARVSATAYAAAATPAGTRAERFDERFLRKLESLAILTRRSRISFGQIRAERRSRRVGAGIEFADHRDYVPGDDLRYLDWNLYGRMERLLVRLFEEDEDLSIYVLFDASASMGVGTPPKLDLAMQVGAALGYVGLANLDRVSLLPI